MKRCFGIWMVCVLLVVMIAGGCSGQGAPTTEGTTGPSAVQTTVPETTEVTEATEPAEDPILTERREKVLEYMRWMQTVVWTPDQDITYTDRVSFENNARTVTLQAGKLYRGIPYTHGSGSGYAFMDYAVSQDERGVWTISGLGVEDLSGSHSEASVFYPRIGNDCADALFWAWGQVANSITFRGTTTMTQNYGCIPVGEYECDVDSHTGTKAFCEKNGMPVMFEAYSKLKPGDGVVTGPDGHAMMISEVNVVRNEDGTVDGVRSSVKIVDQTSANFFSGKMAVDKDLSAMVYYCGNVDEEYYFFKLFNQGYVPVTCRELVDPAPLPEAAVAMSNKAPSLQTLYEGTITSNYRIAGVTITISDQAGSVVQKSTCFGREAEMFEFDMTRFTWDIEQPGLLGILDPDALAAGTYTVTYTCRISTGEEFTTGTFTFEK